MLNLGLTQRMHQPLCTQTAQLNQFSTLQQNQQLLNKRCYTIGQAIEKQEIYGFPEKGDETRVSEQGFIEDGSEKNFDHRFGTYTEEVLAPEEELRTPKFEQLQIERTFSDRLWRQNIRQPAPIQVMAIPKILDGKDVAISSYTGSGKTLAYLLPVIQRAIDIAAKVDASYQKYLSAQLQREGNRRLYKKVLQDSARGRGELGRVQAIIVVPTAELVQQVITVAASILPDSVRGLLINLKGTTGYKHQILKLKNNRPVIAVGTPARIAAHSRSGALRTHRCTFLVLDEIDELLDPVFKPDLERIVEHVGSAVPGGRQTIIASATLTSKVLLKCKPIVKQDCELLTVNTDVAKYGQPGQSVTFQSLLQQAEEVEGQSFKEKIANINPPGVGLNPALPNSHNAAQAQQHKRWAFGKEYGFWDGKNRVASKERVKINRRITDVGQLPSMPPGVDHYYVTCPTGRKVYQLRRAMDALQGKKALVFMNWTQRTKDTAFKLQERNWEVGVLHSQMEHGMRTRMLQQFTQGKLRALVVSDLAARGLDIPNVDIVFNLELPIDGRVYTHRAGRTGRMGAHGRVINIVAPYEQRKLMKLQTDLNTQIKQAVVRYGRFRLGEEVESTAEDRFQVKMGKEVQGQAELEQQQAQ